LLEVVVDGGCMSDNTRHLRQTGWSSTDPVRPNILAGVLRYTGDKQSKFGAYKCMYL